MWLSLEPPSLLGAEHSVGAHALVASGLRGPCARSTGPPALPALLPTSTRPAFPVSAGDGAKAESSSRRSGVTAARSWVIQPSYHSLGRRQRPFLF